jgi:hypothetical protein
MEMFLPVWNTYREPVLFASSVLLNALTVAELARIEGAAA